MTYDGYTAKVFGFSWEGLKVFTVYGFDKQPTRAEVLAVAGDFQKVTRIQVTKRTVTIEHVGCRV